MEIQPLLQGDLSEIPPLLPPGWEASLSTIASYTKSDFCLPIKITLDKKLVGTGTAIIHRDVAWLGHVIVHADYRNLGIGGLITRHLVQVSQAKGCETIYLSATEAGEPVYRKAGFETESEYLCFAAEAGSATFIKPENMIPIENAYLPQIAELDQMASGEHRLFPLEPDRMDGFVYANEQSVQGFYLPGFGDGLIVASTPAAGHALLKLHLSKENFAAIPIDNIPAIDYLTTHNYQVVRTEKRMRLGKQRMWQPQYIFNRMGGNRG